MIAPDAMPPPLIVSKYFFNCINRGMADRTESRRFNRYPDISIITSPALNRMMIEPWFDV
jgi:hypothetical protein